MSIAVAQVRKRDGRIVPFDRERITNAIFKAARAVDQKDGRRVAERITDAVVAPLERDFFSRGRVPSVEEIQDLVEAALIENGYVRMAKAYILYREQRAQVRETEKLLLDGLKLMDDYLECSDWRVNENANMNYSLQGLNFHVASAISARYWLHKIYPSEVQEAHVEGDFHIHDLSILAPYCCGWDLQDLLIRGFGGVPTKTESKPPKHLRSALGQIVNFFYTLQGESAGAQAFSNFDTLLAPFVRYDGLDYREVKQAVQEFIFNINVPTRVGFQCPFTNLTMDLVPPSTLRDRPVIVGGEFQEETYGDFQREMDLINRAFAEVMLEGDAKGRVFTFPIPTFNISKDFDWENSAPDVIWQMTSKYGIPYFCLEENTAVLRSDHTAVPIKSVCVGDELLGEEGQPVKVTAVFYRQAGEVVRIKLTSGKEIVATPTHRFPTQNGLKQAQELSLNDKLLRIASTEIELELSGLRIGLGELRELFSLFKVNDDLSFDLLDVERLRAGQVVYLQPKPIANQDTVMEFEYNRDDHDTTSQQIRIPSHATPKLCRFLGYLVGDGYYAKSNHTIKFVNAEEEVLTDYKACLEDLFGVRHQTRQAGDSEVAAEVSVHSVMLRDLLYQLGLQRVTARDKTVPHVVYQCSESGIANFIRGLFDTDGSVAKRRVITFTSSSEKLVRQVQVLLLRLGIMSKIRHDNDAYKITITGNNVKRYAEVVGSTSSRKRERLKQHAAKASKNSLGEPLLERKSQVIRLIEAGRLPKHYNYKDLYKGRFYRLPRSALSYLFPGDEPVFADVVSERMQSGVENVAIAQLSHEVGKFNVVDISVDSQAHLFSLYGGILSHNSNFINSGMKPEDARSMCCRLRLDNRELRKRGGGYFGANPLTGSIGVVTINMARLGYLATDEEDFFHRLSRLMEIAKTSLEIKRKTLENFTERGLYPYARHYLASIKKIAGAYWANHFSTIGLNGMNEACLNFLGVSIAHPDGKALALKTLHFMREKLRSFQAETGNLYNLEATPAEGASYRLAKVDKAHFPDIITAGTDEAPYYTNSTHLPVGYTDDVFEALEHQDDLQVLYTGGTVFHAFLGERIDGWRQARLLVRRIAENFRLPYYTLTPTFSICPIHGYVSGEHFYCPYHHTPDELKGVVHEDSKVPCEVYSRIVGYLRPLRNWNVGKKQEFAERREYVVASHPSETQTSEVFKTSEVSR